MGINSSVPNIPIPHVVGNPYLRIALEKEMTFQDEPIKGEIWLEPTQPVILSDIIIRLKLQEGWVYNETSDKVISEINGVILSEKALNIGKILNIPTNLISLSAGKFHFPFSISPPGPIQPSFEHPFPNRRGYVRYSLQAETISQYFKTIGENAVIIKSRPLVLNSPLLFSSCVNVHNWGFFQKGTTILNASYPTNNYKIGDAIPLTINVDNSRGMLDVVQLKIVLIRKTTFTKINQPEKYSFEKIICNQDYNFLVPSRTRNSYNCAIKLRDNDLSFNYNGVYNPYPYLNDCNTLMPSVDSLTIKCEYSIKVSTYFNSYVTYSYRPRVVLPLSVTHQLIEDYKLEKKEKDDLEKAIEASKIEVMQQFRKDSNENVNLDGPLIENDNNGGKQEEVAVNGNNQIFMSAMDLRNNNQIFQQKSFGQVALQNNDSNVQNMNMSVFDNFHNNYSYYNNNNGIAKINNNLFDSRNEVIDPYNDPNNNNQIETQKIDNSYSQCFQNNVQNDILVNSQNLINDIGNSAPVVDINRL